jgi:flagellar export protein FliJ
MPKFVFPLHALLAQRKRTEQECQRLLAVEAAALTTLTDQLKALDDRATAANHDLRTHRLVGQVDVAFLAGHRRFMLAIQRQAMALVPQIQAQQQRVQSAQSALTAAAIQRKVIEKLREQQFNRWHAELAKKEAADLDEVGMKLAYTQSQE